MILQSGTSPPKSSLSNGSYGNVPMSTRTACQGPSPRESRSRISVMTSCRFLDLRTYIHVVSGCVYVWGYMAVIIAVGRGWEIHLKGEKSTYINLKFLFKNFQILLLYILGVFQRQDPGFQLLDCRFLAVIWSHGEGILDNISIWRERIWMCLWMFVLVLSRLLEYVPSILPIKAYSVLKWLAGARKWLNRLIIVTRPLEWRRWCSYING